MEWAQRTYATLPKIIRQGTSRHFVIFQLLGSVICSVRVWPILARHSDYRWGPSPWPPKWTGEAMYLLSYTNVYPVLYTQLSTAIYTAVHYMSRRIWAMNVKCWGGTLNVKQFLAEALSDVEKNAGQIGSLIGSTKDLYMFLGHFPPHSRLLFKIRNPISAPAEVVL